MARPMNVLLTGGTGFLGEYLLAELLARGHRVWCLYRSEPRKLDTIRFLGSLGLPESTGSLGWVKGDTLDAADAWAAWCGECPGLAGVDTLLHGAASTRLHMDGQGEPLRTNLGSARALRSLVARHPMSVHLVSTAYVCGLVQDRLIHEVPHPMGDFVNVYEESKWEAEQVWKGDATLLRPSVIVGHSETGRCTSFSGWYILFQAVHLLDRLLRANPWLDRLHLDIEIPADPAGTINIIPVDYVAKAAIRILENPGNHNRIFHLSHPDPPTHRWTLDFICRRFNLGGLGFGSTAAPLRQPRNRIERMVWRQIQTILLHFSNNPRFDRTNTDQATSGIEVPAMSEGVVSRLIDCAIGRDWGGC